MDLDTLLQEISVHSPEEWRNEDGPPGWWAVSDENGIIAYFGKEEVALWFRLTLINNRLNLIG